MQKEIIVHSTRLETRLAILKNNKVSALFIERAKNKGILGNIYKGRVTKVLPGMQAAFVDIGLERHGFLYVGDFLEDLQEESELFDHKKTRPSKSHGKKQPTTRHGKKQPTTSPDKLGEPQLLSKKELSRFPETRSASSGKILPKHLTVKALAEDTSASMEQKIGLGILPARLLGTDSKKRRSKGKRKDKVAIDESPSRLSFFTKVDHKKKSSRNAKPAKTGANRKSRKSSEEDQIKIAEVLKKGQEILVQVAKEPIGRKGARLTSHVAIPGRYMVYMPTVENIGVSRQIESQVERNRLKEIVVGNRGKENRGFIVRTAGEGQADTNIINDMDYLRRLWSRVREQSEPMKAPALIHAEPGLVERTIRDRLKNDFRAIRVDSEETYQDVVEFVNTFNPDFVEKVKLHTKAGPILDEFEVTSEIENALQSKVWIRNGAYIVINQTEALVAIDVNSGKYVGKTSSLEDTITQVNIDAAGEIVRQMRLRGLGGIIILDFIDMEESKNRRKVLDELHRALARDNVPSRILGFNEFGLVAITRKRDRSSLEKTLCQPCFYCEGRGMTKSLRTIAYSIHEDIKTQCKYYGEGSELFIRCHPQVAQALRENEPEVLEEIKEMTRKMITVQADPMLHIERFTILEA